MSGKFGDRIDAKCHHPARAVGAREFQQAATHQRVAPGNSQSIIIVAKTDRVTIWEDVVNLREPDGIWPVVIIPKKLLEDVRLALDAANIESRPVWKPMHMQPVYEQYEAIGGAVAERLFRDGLCLPSGSLRITAEISWARVTSFQIW